MIKLIVITFLSSLVLPSILMSASLTKSELSTTSITDPAISSRCDKLLQRRTEKISHKQKITALVVRSERLLETMPKEKKSIYDKVENTLRLLRNEQNYTLTVIDRLEEDIVRQGCPGITL